MSSLAFSWGVRFLPISSTKQTGTCCQVQEVVGEWGGGVVIVLFFFTVTKQFCRQIFIYLFPVSSLLGIYIPKIVFFFVLGGFGRPSLCRWCEIFGDDLACTVESVDFARENDRCQMRAAVEAGHFG